MAFSCSQPAGLTIAAYLTTVYVQDLPPARLGGSSGCATVQHSDYAHLAGIPIPLFGLAGYALLFACLPGQRARTAGMVLTVTAIAASAVLTYLELNVIYAVCSWCVASAICASVHVVVNWIRYVRGEPRFVTRPQRRLIGLSLVTGPASVQPVPGGPPRNAAEMMR